MNMAMPIVLLLLLLLLHSHAQPGGGGGIIAAPGAGLDCGPRCYVWLLGPPGAAASIGAAVQQLDGELCYS